MTLRLIRSSRYVFAQYVFGGSQRFSVAKAGGPQELSAFLTRLPELQPVPRSSVTDRVLGRMDKFSSPLP